MTKREKKDWIDKWLEFFEHFREEEKRKGGRRNEKN